MSRRRFSPGQMEALAFFYVAHMAPVPEGINLGSVVALHAMGLLRHHPEDRTYSLTDAGIRAFQANSPPVDRDPLRVAIRSALVHLRRGQVQAAIQLLDACATPQPTTPQPQEDAQDA